MPKFKYKIRDGADGSEVLGVASAVDRFTLAAELRGSSKVIISIEEVKSMRISGLDLIDNFLGKVKMHELIVFYHNLGIMMTAGLSLSRVLSILEQQTKNKKFKESMAVSMKDIGREGKMKFIREKWHFLPASNLPNKKVFVIEKLRKIKSEGRLANQKYWKEGEIEYRIGYYIIGSIGRAKDRWVWGQFCPIIPEKDLMKIMKQIK
jgi:hypothetical protein